jgi:hypothetical protein
MIVAERVVRWAKTSLTMLLLCAVPAIGALGERHQGTPGRQPRGERAPLALVGYVSPSEAAPRWLGLAGAWSATQGRNLLAQYGLPVPALPRVLEAYRVDLDGDGREDVLWTARSRDGWDSPIPNTPGGPRSGDYALLGLRFLTPHGVRSVALALAAAGDDCFQYRLFSPVDLNGDGRMEIVAHSRGFEDDSLLVFTFDGRRVAGVLGTRLPDDQLMARARGSRPDLPVPPKALSQRHRTGSDAATNAARVKAALAVEHAMLISSALGDITNHGEPHEIAALARKAGRYSAVPSAPRFRRPPSRPPATRQRIVFAHGVDQRDGGDLWIVGTDGRDAQRLTSGATFHDLAVDRDRIACLRWGKAPTMDTNLYVLSPPDWRPRRVTMGGAFGRACWIPGTDQLFIGRGTDDPACDEGLYEVDVRRQTRRRLLAPIHGDGDARHGHLRACRAAGSAALLPSVATLSRSGTLSHPVSWSES